MFLEPSSQERFNLFNTGSASTVLLPDTSNTFASAAYGLVDPVQGKMSAASSAGYGNISSIDATSLTNNLVLAPIIRTPILITDNTLATANNLGSLTGTITRNGFVGSSDTVDFYRLNLAGSSLNLTLTGLSSDADLQLLRDLNGNGVVDSNEIIAYSNRGGSNDESINLHGLTSGEYFVQVSRYSGDTNYTLRLSPNSTSNLLATEMNVGVLSGTQTFTNPSYSEGETLARRNGISSTDTSDIYRFSLNTVRNVGIALTGLSNNADVRLIQDLNNDGIVQDNEIIARSTHGSNWNEAINRNLDVGSYFVQVYRFSGDTGYSLKLTETAPQVNLNISQVQALNNPDSGWFGDDADFYSRVRINGTTLTSEVVSNNNNAFPNWNFTRSVNSRYVSIEVEMWDSDGGLAGADDRIDINPGAGQNLNITFDVVTGAITGDVSGSRGQLLTIAGNSGDRARMWFTVNTGDWYTLNLKDAGIQDLTRSFAADGQLSRMDMINILRDVKDGNTVSATELTDLRTVLNSLNYMMPEYVRVLSNKIINSDPANARSGIGNLAAGSTGTQLERLIGKWFLGNDRPVAISYDRTTTYTYQSVTGNLFQGGISFRDVQQNNLGDCYFLAALGAVAFDSPTTIQNMFVSHNDDNGDGIIDSWTVRMFNNGVADYVTVDRFLPTGADGRAVFAGWGGGHFSNPNNELWVALLEKAYAQFNESGWIGQDNTNSYNGTTLSTTPVSNNNAGINGGFAEVALRQITGLNAARHGMTTNFLFIRISDSVNEMINAFNNDRMVVLCTPSNPESIIVGNHCYTLVGYNAATDRFQIYNPWATDGGSSVDGANDGLRWISRTQLLASFDEWAALS
ncbi:Calpain family cysteine protease,pre-peptidase C family protein [Leptolyngbyaceae cyanobacterium JSC-12]|nr:Calpain family cysteine protease,pre-peptidase C family protein [Leptolyngbyaceae cyanobacterium JSC-12]